jgi:serine/threonine-protein kinase
MEPIKTIKWAVLGAIALGLIIVNVTAQCSVVDTNDTVAVPVESSSGIYENSTYGFSMSYPAGWIVKEAEPNSMGMVVGFLAPGGDINNPTNYITVQIENLPSSQKIALDEYTSAVISNLESSYKDFKLLTTKNLTLGNLPGKELLYTIDNVGTPYEILLQYTIKDNKAYVLTYYAQEDSYAQLEDGAREILSSFGFNDAKSTTDGSKALLTPLPFSRSE